MEEETLHLRYLVVLALVLGALIVGYNAFYVPDASLSGLTVSTDVSSAAVSAAPDSSASASGEEYTPKSPASSAVGKAVSAAPKSAAGGKININTATAQQLNDGLDGIGDVMAKRIVDYREQHGAFRSVSELKNVSGIGEKIFAKIQNAVTIDG